jgi:hypothetical protein
MVTVCDDHRKHSEPVKVPIEASWDQMMTAWRVQAREKGIDFERYPGFATAYVFETDSGDPVTSMDGLSRAFAHYLLTVISQPAPDGTGKIKLSKDFRVLPTETERDLLEHWQDAVRRGQIECKST